MEKGIIERAYELAPECGTIDEVRAALRREGYSNVDAHLAGRRIRADLGQIVEQSSLTARYPIRPASTCRSHSRAASYSSFSISPSCRCSPG